MLVSCASSSCCGILTLMGLTAALEFNIRKPYNGTRNEKFHNWFPEVSVRTNVVPRLKHAEIKFRNRSVANSDAPQYYTYGYKVYEPKVGELKEHTEFRNGGLIHGVLQVVERSGANTNITYEGLPWVGWQALVETRELVNQTLSVGNANVSKVTSKPSAGFTLAISGPCAATVETPVSKMSTWSSKVGTKMATVWLKLTSKMSTFKHNGPTPAEPKMFSMSTTRKTPKKSTSHDQIAQSWENVQNPERRTSAVTNSPRSKAFFHQMNTHDSFFQGSAIYRNRALSGGGKLNPMKQSAHHQSSPTAAPPQSNGYRGLDELEQRLRHLNIEKHRSSSGKRV